MSDGIEQWKLMSKEELYNETEMLRRIIGERKDEIIRLQEREDLDLANIVEAARVLIEASDEAADTPKRRALRKALKLNEVTF